MSQEIAAKKRKRVPVPEVVVVNSNPTNAPSSSSEDGLRAALLKAYTAPLSDEQLRAKPLQVFSIAILEGMQRAMLQAVMTAEEASESAEKALQKYMKRLCEGGEMPCAFRVLWDVIAAEKSGSSSLESYFGMDGPPQMIMGESVSLQYKAAEPTDGCLFKILRKVNAFMQAHPFLRVKSAAEAQALLKQTVEEQIKQLLAKRLVAAAHRQGAHKELDDAIEELRGQKKELERDKRQIREKIEEKTLGVDKLNAQMDETMAALTEGLPADGGDTGERGHMLRHLETMKFASRQALDEMIKMDKREFAAIDEKIAALDVEMAEKREEKEKAEEAGVLNEEAIREFVQGLYAKVEGATSLCGIRKQMGEFMALPEVAQEMRIHIYENTSRKFKELLHPPPPPRA